MQPREHISIPDTIIAISELMQKMPENEIREKLIALINELINKDFDALVQLLYRIDVNEEKIRTYLQQNKNEDSAAILADLIMQRQLQKIESRKQFKENDRRQSDEEKW